MLTSNLLPTTRHIIHPTQNILPKRTLTITIITTNIIPPLTLTNILQPDQQIMRPHNSIIILEIVTYHYLWA